jgi:hypothetical protein
MAGKKIRRVLAAPRVVPALMVGGVISATTSGLSVTPASIPSRGDVMGNLNAIVSVEPVNDSPMINKFHLT